jgi:hypothetical protein
MSRASSLSRARFYTSWVPIRRGLVRRINQRDCSGELIAYVIVRSGLRTGHGLLLLLQVPGDHLVLALERTLLNRRAAEAARSS